MRFQGMPARCLALIAALAIVVPASGIHVTIDTAQTDLDTLVFDVEWQVWPGTPSGGPLPEPDTQSDVFWQGDAIYFRVSGRDKYPASTRLIDLSVWMQDPTDPTRQMRIDAHGIRYDTDRQLVDFAGWVPGSYSLVQTGPDSRSLVPGIHPDALVSYDSSVEVAVHSTRFRYELQPGVPVPDTVTAGGKLMLAVAPVFLLFVPKRFRRV